MGVSTDGEIWYGVILGEQEEDFPWEEEGDIEFWWQEKHSPGLMDLPTFEERHEERKRVEREHPLPVELVNYCSCDYPMYALAVPGVGLSASRGYPEKFNPYDLPQGEEMGEAVDRLLNFCHEYNIEFSDGPSWFLSSLWC
jgi:hypothetical protein